MPRRSRLCRIPERTAVLCTYDGWHKRPRPWQSLEAGPSLHRRKVGLANQYSYNGIVQNFRMAAIRFMVQRLEAHTDELEYNWRLSKRRIQLLGQLHQNQNGGALLLASSIVAG